MRGVDMPPDLLSKWLALLAVETEQPANIRFGSWLICILSIAIAVAYLLLTIPVNLSTMLPAGHVVFRFRSLLVVLLALWIGFRHPWRATSAAVQHQGRIVNVVCSSLMGLLVVVMWLDPQLFAAPLLGIAWYALAIVTLGQVWWLSRHGFVQLGAQLLLLGGVMHLVTITGSQLQVFTTSFVYVIVLIIAGAVVRWWVGTVLTISMPLVATILQVLGWSVGVPDWRVAALYVVWLCVIAALIALGNRSLQRALIVAEQRATALTAAQTELSNQHRQLLEHATLLGNARDTLQVVIAEQHERIAAGIADVRQHEAQYRGIFEASGDGLLILDQTGRVVEANPAACRIYGYHYDQLVGNNGTMLLDKSSHRIDFTTITNETTNEYQAVHRRCDGTPILVEIRCTPCPFAGEPHLLLVVRDITERQRTEAALRESEERYRIVAESVMDAIITINEQSTIVFANAAATRIFGYAVDELVGQSLTLLMPDGIQHQHHTGFQNYLTTNQKRLNWTSISTTARRHDGMPLVLDISFGEYRHGSARFFTGVLRDTTDRTRAQATQQFLTHVSQTFASSIDYETTLQTLAALAVEHLADWCAIDVLEETGELQRLVVIHKDPSKAEVAHELRLQYPPDLTRHEGVAKVLRSNQPNIVTDWSDERFYASTENDRHRFLIRTLGAAGFVQVPLRARGKTIGVLTLVSATSYNRYGPQEVLVAEELGQRAGLAIDNALLYREAQSSMQRAEEARILLDTIVATTPIGLAFFDTALRSIHYNSALTSLLGVAPEVLHEQTLEHVRPDVAAIITPFLQHVRETGTSVSGVEIRIAAQAANEVEHTCLTTVYPVYKPDGSILGEGLAIVDVTERKRLEAQLLQAQKMESIGQLAGGIAHDFNNLLMVITGNAELAIHELPEAHVARDELNDIIAAGNRGRNLIRQLLAFASKQVITPQVVSVNTIISNLDTLLRRLITSDISFETRLESSIAQVKVDSGQIEQVLINLVVNACHAMPMGGTLTLETANVVVRREQQAQHHELLPGAYVRVMVQDTGLGMTEQIQRRIFEPFFTTKLGGQGTGLGLATCYGIVKQHGGAIEVTSAPNAGTTFSVYLPHAETGKVQPRLQRHDDSRPRGRETILLAEDEAGVRRFVANVLRKHGYTVLESAHGDEAIAVAQAQQGNGLALLLTDVMMPKMTGDVVAERIRALYPTIPVVFMSGYADTDLIDQGRLDNGVTLLPKPFSGALLVQTVRRALDEPQHIVCW